ncbi:hypothetical protein M404DRAFT_1007118 [Pisolithus tinctorius Marx 270]|uniref:Uncharacterized protein n=1 Tax=Pisolithus tinctorius Marx 270 TaxID=870435 RepID=A0A0C3N4F2_PISTI|nr:hypothetical protein M404DRAFT_1007118 [Pisolithus tinctorius Marx 270]
MVLPFVFTRWPLAVSSRLLKPRKAINTSDCACGGSSLSNHRSVSAALAMNML